jgi:RES domain-containing protein
MRIWRISNYADLSGIGGLKAAGRWHDKGRPVVYAADHQASALLEVLVHFEIDIEDAPDSYQLLEIDVPAEIVAHTIEEHELLKISDEWRSDLHVTRGQTLPWFQDLKTPIVRVPSAIMSGVYNYLINPLQADAAKITVVSAVQHPFDQRLLGAGSMPLRTEAGK